MKLVVAVLVVLLGQQPSAGFLPVQNHFARRELLATQGLGVDKADVSIPYDAAARLAYDQWRVDFNKGDFDPVRFQIFKDNYEIVTVANVKAKKKARDEGTVSLSLMSLNEFGDWTQEEFFGAQQQVDPSIGAPQPTTTSDILGKAVEAVELQTEASNALEEAFDALAIEEQKLVEALGLESVDELEEALDSLEGIAPDGGELETSTLAREARIRDAYLKWCKEFNKEPDESRYPRFSQNFLFMEQYIKTTGKEMALNMYADFSKEEYEAAVKGSSSIPTKDPAPPKTEPPKPAPETTVATKTPSTPEPKVAVPAPAAPKPVAPENGPFLTTEDVLGAAIGVTKSFSSAFGAATSFAKNAKTNILKSIDEGLKEIEESAETEETRQKRLERLAAEQMEFEKAAAAARAERVRAIQERAKQEEERREQIEKERNDRLKLSEKEAAKAKATAEAMAIASAKAEAERQAEMAARRAYLEAQAVEQTRKKARELEEKLKSRRPIPPPPTKKSISPTNMFANFFSKEGETKKPPAAKKAPITKPPIKKTSGDKVSLFSAPKSAPLGPPPMPTPVTKAPAKISTPSTPTFSLFPKKSISAKKESTVSNVIRPAPAPRPTMFSPTPAKSKTPAPVQKEENSPVFSFFSSPSRKEASTKEAPKSVAKPQKVQYSPTLSLFNAPVKPKEIAPAPAPKPEKAPAAFSFFGSPATPQVSAKPQVPKIPNRAGTISLFGSNSKPKKEQPVKSSPSISLFGKGTESKTVPPPAAPKSSGTISLFGSGKGSAAQKPSVEKAAVQKKAAVTFFGSAKVSGSASSPAAAKAAPPKNVPILSRWKQNSDGSITGKVSNSPNFNPGTEITTSPVRKGATAGSVVKTGSGSQYYLA